MKNNYIKKQNWFELLILLIVTLGIYSIFWFRRFALDANKNKKEIYNKFLFNIYIFTSIIYALIFIFLLILRFLSESNPIFVLEILNFIKNNILINWFLSNIFYFDYFIFLILLYNVKTYLKNYDIENNFLLTMIIPFIQTQYTINQNYDKISSGLLSEEKLNSIKNEFCQKNEYMAKDYINKHKDNYSKESIKEVLMKVNLTEKEIDVYLNKYY